MAVKKQFNSFEEMITLSETPVLVDFYATWCGPCKVMAQILEQVKERLQDRLRVVKIDNDKYAELSTQFNIEALPTLILFKNGQPIDRIEGVMQADQLLQRWQGVI